MLDNILNELKGAIGNDVQQKAGLEPDKANKAIELAGESAKEVAEEEVKRGNMQGLMSLLGSKAGATHENPLVGKIGANLVAKLVDQLGMNPQTAKQVEGVIVPLMINFVSDRFQNTGGGMGGIAKVLGGSKLGGMLGGFFK